MLEVGRNLDDGPFDFAVDRKDGLASILLFGSDNIVIDAHEWAIVFYEVSTVLDWLHRVLEQADVLQLGIPDVGLAQLVIVQVQDLHLGEYAEL